MNDMPEHPIKRDYISVIVAVTIFIATLCLSKTDINSLGLCLDIFGFILLYDFGFPGRFGTTWDFPNESPRHKFVKTMAYIGFICVVLGFSMQFYASIHS